MTLPFPGRITEYESILGEKSEHSLTVTPLLTTFQQPAGIVMTQLVTQGLRSGGLGDKSWERNVISVAEPMNLAVRIQGVIMLMPSLEMQLAGTPAQPQPVNIDVILVSDIDLFSNTLLRLRKESNDSELNFDNVTFVLNAIDSIAGDDRFIEIRSRRSKHRTLSKFDEHTDSIRKATADEKKRLQEEFEGKVAAEQKALQDKRNQLREELGAGTTSEGEAAIKWATAMRSADKRLIAESKRLQWELDIKLERADVDLNEHINRVKGQYKLWSVVLPPIPPLLIALAVLFVRRLRESGGVPTTRRRK
jgi:hypothetical protein